MLRTSWPKTHHMGGVHMELQFLLGFPATLHICNSKVILISDTQWNSRKDRLN